MEWVFTEINCHKHWKGKQIFGIKQDADERKDKSSPANTAALRGK